MSDDNKNRDEDRGGKKNGEFRVPPRTYIIWIAIIGAIPLLMLFKNTGPVSADILSQTQFMQAFASNQIVQGTSTIAYDPQSLLHEVRGKYFKTDKSGLRIEAGGKPAEAVPFVAKVRLTDKYEDQLLLSGLFETKAPDRKSTRLNSSHGGISRMPSSA